jgi:CBS domain-containing protein
VNGIRAPRTVSELMKRNPILVVEDMSVVDAAKFMEFYGVGGLPVVDWDGELVGVISDTDLHRARTTKELWGAWPHLAVRHLMTRPAATVTADCGVEEAAELMERLHVDGLVVIGADGETPIGILSVSDLVRRTGT